MSKLLAIDARPLSRGAGGIQRYLRKILPYIIENQAFKVVIYTDHPISTCFTKGLENIKIRSISGNFGRSFIWHFIVCIWTANDKPDLFWSPRHHLPFFLPKKTRRLVTIHDFVWKTYPSTMPKLQLAAEKLLMPSSIKRANHIICVSQTTQSQLKRYFPTQAHKSSVILHGVEKQTVGVEINDKNNCNYFLAVGTVEPRKNYERLLKAFDSYAKKGGTKNLIIVGKIGWGSTHIKGFIEELANSERIKVLTAVSDNELHKLYSQACGFVSPSLDEGYGLPTQEAINYRLPILLSDIDVYRELYPKANYWANPVCVSELTLGFKKLEKTPKSQMVSSHKTEYSWDACSKKHCALFSRED